MSNVYRLGVRDGSQIHSAWTTKTTVQWVIAESWDAFKQTIQPEGIAYVPSYIVANLDANQKSANGNLIELAGAARRDFGLPKYLVSGNEYDEAPSNPTDAAERLAHDIIANVRSASLSSEDDVVIWIWIKFFSEAISLQRFVQVLGDERTRRGESPKQENAISVGSPLKLTARRNIA